MVSTADLIAALERLRLRPPSVPDTAAATQAQLDVAFARVAALTEILRNDEGWTDTSRLAARLLLADLGAISARFRAEASEAAALLARGLESIRTPEAAVGSTDQDADANTAGR